MLLEQEAVVGEGVAEGEGGEHGELGALGLQVLGCRLRARLRCAETLAALGAELKRLRFGRHLYEVAGLHLFFIIAIFFACFFQLLCLFSCLCVLPYYLYY